MPSDSEVGIARDALRRIGANAIISFTDPTTEGILANDTYDQIRDDYLSDNPWSFAKKRVDLAASATAPEWGYERAFPVPADFLRLLEVEDQLPDAVKMENVDDKLSIVTDLPAPINILYIAKVTDPNLMNVKFKEALIWKCAVTWAEALTATSSVVERAAIAYARADQLARAADGQQGTPDLFGIDTWINAR